MRHFQPFRSQLNEENDTQISARIQGRCQDVWSLLGFSHVRGDKKALEERAEDGIKEKI